MIKHIPVLLNEVLANLDPQSNQNFIDCTLGGGGHAQVILERIKPNGRLLGIDTSPEAIEAMRQSIKDNSDWQQRLILANDNFVNLKKIAQENSFAGADGILFDLGFSTDLLESNTRGLSFQKDGPLDMRFNLQQQKLTAAEIINSWPAADLENIFKNFGEERYSRSIVKAILASRKSKKIITTLHLAAVIEQAVDQNYLVKTLARIFQALRIAVNNELDNLFQALPQAIDLLNKNGRLAAISFHSLEDRIVKNIFKESPSINILTKKPIVAAESEIAVNPRARSAKLRVAQKI
jgi:16S rRNA (cytosine1402-N4)-methyltransferase